MSLRIATWNVNSAKARLPNILDWIDAVAPDVLLLQEIKCVDGDFPRLEFEAKGYKVATHGQKTYNGVAVLSRRPILEEKRGLPGNPETGEARYLECLLEGGVRVASLYVPQGQSPDSDRFPFKLGVLDAVIGQGRDMVLADEAVVLGADWNVCPEPDDVHDPVRWDGHVHFHPLERQRIRTLLNQGWTDGFRALHPGPGHYSWWDYRAGGWQRDEGLRIDYLLLNPRAADRLLASGIDRGPRGKEKASDHTPVWVDLDI